MADEPVIDACAFHDWGGPLALGPYMSRGYQQWVARPGDKVGPRQVKSLWVHDNPAGRHDPNTRPENGVPGSSLKLMQEQLFGSGKRDRVVLGYDDGLLATASPNAYLAREVVKAANDWTIHEWLEKDERLYGMVLISNALPDDAAAEIRRVGTHERMVAVAMGANCLARGFGHPTYGPIHRAAAETDLPLVIQSTSECASDLVLPTLAGGRPATFSEWEAQSAQPMSAHLASFVTNGVFDMYPGLRVLLIGGGAAWIPAFVWRQDYWYKIINVDVPWMKSVPSEYIAESARFGTAGLEKPARGSLEPMLKQLPDGAASLMYASGYPNYDWEEPDAIAARIPGDWGPAVFRQNALDFFRWPNGGKKVHANGVSREDIAGRTLAQEAPTIEEVID